MAEEPHCPADYKGTERRVLLDRRADACMYHEAHEIRFDNAEAKSRLICKNVDTVKAIIDTKVPMKLFYSTAGGVFFLLIVILGVQWGAYMKVNEATIAHVTAMGEINSTITEVKLEVKHGNEMSKSSRQTIKDTLEQQTKLQEKKMNGLQKQIEKLHNEG